MTLHQECRCNGTFFRDIDLYINGDRNNDLHCVLPGETLDGGEWLRPDGQPVNCNDVTGLDPFLCTNTTSPNATITLYLKDDEDFAPFEPGNSGIELQYKCCLPTSCSDPNTNIMVINVFGEYFTTPIKLIFLDIFTDRMYISEIYVDLPSNVSIIPQSYTIHCVVMVGEFFLFFFNSFDLKHFYEGNPDIQLNASYCDSQSGYNCVVNSQPRYGGNYYYYDETLTVEWEAKNISSGAFVNTAFTGTGDHVHRCTAIDEEVNRNAYLTVAGKLLYQMFS